MQIESSKLTEKMIKKIAKNKRKQSAWMMRQLIYKFYQIAFAWLNFMYSYIKKEVLAKFRFFSHKHTIIS